MTIETLRQIIDSIAFGDLELDNKNWIDFWLLPTMTFEAKKEYLAMLVNNGMQDILYDNPQIQASFSGKT